MHKLVGIATIAALLAGCTSQIDEDNPTVDPAETDDDTIVIPVDPVDPNDEDEEPDPIVVVVDGQSLTIGGIASASYDGTDLRVLIPLDGSSGEQDYDFVENVGDYQRFTFQQGDLSRDYSAVAGQSAGGEVVAVAVLDGGQFNRFFGGATVIQDGYTAPESGSVQYQGDYAGLVNLGISSDDGVEFPSAGSLVDGTAIIIAEFGALPLVNGGIVDRTLYFDGDEYDLQDLALIATDVGATGLFAGSVENLDLIAVGSYTGAFGGDDAAFVGGNIVIDDRGLIGVGADKDLLQTILGEQLGDVQEYGIFVLAPCVGAACNTLP